MTGWKAWGISDALTKGFAEVPGCSIDPFYDIDPCDQGEFLTAAIRSDDSAEEENHEEIKDN